MNSSPPQGHLNQLDPLRGIAIAAVILFHCLGTTFYRDQLPWNGNWRTTADVNGAFLVLLPLSFGWAGVSLFFVISGFVIHYSTLRRGELDLVTFAGRRFWRIVPPYLIALTLFTGLELAGWLGGRPTVGSIVAHALLIQNASDAWIYDINPSFWSLATECQLYVLYPLLWHARRRRGTGAVLLLPAIVSLIVRVSASLLAGWDEPLWLWRSAPMLWFDWALGAWICERFVSGRRAFSKPAGTAAVVGMLALIAYSYRPTAAHLYPLVAILSAILVEWTLHHRPFAKADRSWLGRMGVCSYSLYLFHQPFLPYARELTEKIPHLPGLIRFAVIAAIAFCLATLIGPGLFRWLEEPFMAWGRRREQRRRQIVAQASIIADPSRAVAIEKASS